MTEDNHENPVRLNDSPMQFWTENLQNIISKFSHSTKQPVRCSAVEYTQGGNDEQVGDSEQIEPREKPAYREQWCGSDTSLPLLINEK
jgi:hypothetical protein